MMGNIYVDLNEYKLLIQKSVLLDMLTDVVYQNATLSWDKKRINVDDDKVMSIMKLIEPQRYAEELERLIEEDKKNE